MEVRVIELRQDHAWVEILAPGGEYLEVRVDWNNLTGLEKPHVVKRDSENHDVTVRYELSTPNVWDYTTQENSDEHKYNVHQENSPSGICFCGWCEDYNSKRNRI